MPRVPNRSADLAPSSVRKRKSRGHSEITKGTSRPLWVPEVEEHWHPAAKQTFKSAIESGQADFYESSDAMALWLLCDEIDYHLTHDRRSPERFKAIMSGVGQLLLTESDRRKVRIELESVDGSPYDARAAVDALFED